MLAVVNGKGGELGVEERRAKSLGLLEGVRRRRETERVMGVVGVEDVDEGCWEEVGGEEGGKIGT